MALLTKKETTTITAIRSHCLQGIQEHFPKMQNFSEYCPLKSAIGEQQQKYTQEQLLKCKVLGDQIDINMSSMYSKDVK